MAHSQSVDITASPPLTHLSFSPTYPPTPLTISITAPTSATLPPGTAAISPTHLATAHQWTILKHAHTLPPSQLQTVTVDWLSSFDRTLLLALLIRTDEEKELLRAELAHAQYVVKTRRDRAQGSIGDWPLSPGTCPVGVKARDSMLPPPPKGIVGRRKSSILPPFTPTFLSLSKETEEDEVSTDLRAASAVLRNKRIIAEAGWCWIEGHLDFYADMFAENESRTKEELWAEVVEVREECEGLAARLGGDFGEVHW